MSLAIAHFAFGATVTTLVLAAVGPTFGYPRTVVLAGGGWALVPDLHWVSPVARRRLHRIHESSPVTDLFWLHRTLDRVDPADSKTVAAALVAALLLATALAEWRGRRSPGTTDSSREPTPDSDSRQ
jgi:hypothetical protein